MKYNFVLTDGRHWFKQGITGLLLSMASLLFMAAMLLVGFAMYVIYIVVEPGGLFLVFKAVCFGIFFTVCCFTGAAIILGIYNWANK